MSKKKKGKPAARKAPKQAAKKSVSKARAGARLASGAATGRTSQVTIFLYRTANGNKIRTAPQLATAGPGHIEWTVVNLVDGSDVPVTITWPGEGPWGKEPIEVHGMRRCNADNATAGRFKYVVSALDAQEDPEVEFPEN